MTQKSFFIHENIHTPPLNTGFGNRFLVAHLVKKYSNISFDKIDDFWKPQNLKKQIMLILSFAGLMKNYSKTSSDNSWKLHCMKILKIQKWYHNCVLWTNIADGIFWGIWTSCRLVSICGKRIKSSCYRMCYFKVVIPSTSYGKKNVFSTRHDEVSISGHDIWWKGLEIDTHKPPKFIWSYQTHAVNTRWPQWSRKPKFTF